MKPLNIAPPIAADELTTADVYFEDLKNAFCLKTNVGIICFCSTIAECDLLTECKMANIARNQLNINP